MCLSRVNTAYIRIHGPRPSRLPKRPLPTTRAILPTSGVLSRASIRCHVAKPRPQRRCPDYRRRATCRRVISAASSPKYRGHPTERLTPLLPLYSSSLGWCPIMPSLELPGATLLPRCVQHVLGAGAPASTRKRFSERTRDLLELTR